MITRTPPRTASAMYLILSEFRFAISCFVSHQSRLKISRHLNRQQDAGHRFGSRSPAICPRLLIGKVDRLDDKKMFFMLELIDECPQVRVLAEYSKVKAHVGKRVEDLVGLIALLRARFLRGLVRIGDRRGSHIDTACKRDTVLLGERVDLFY